MKTYITLLVLFGLLISEISYSQDVNVKIGIRDSIQSKILDENRPLIISLPNDYDTSNKAYPVLYVLDGLESILLEAIVVTL